jgi:alpha-2-macroglobulin
MKILKLFLFLLPVFVFTACGTGEGEKPKFPIRKPQGSQDINLPIDKGFSEYIAGYTSGVVSINSPFEIRFTPEFAAKTGKKVPGGLFQFDPIIKGKADWTDDVTLTFRPSKPLDPGTIYSGTLFIGRLGEVRDNLKEFPIRIRTIKRDFIVTTGLMECTDNGASYMLHGDVTASDFIPSDEVESCLRAAIGRKKAAIVWDHSDARVHAFTVTGITRGEKTQKLELEWDGSKMGSKHKGSMDISIPRVNEFSVIDVISNKDESQNIDIVFSDPVDPAQDKAGLVWIKPSAEVNLRVKSNVISLIPASRLEGTSVLNIEKSVRNLKGATLPEQYTRELDFSPIAPAIKLIGNGAILPASKNLIFPFKTVSLKAVDLKIIKIFENNLPYFLQENEITSGYSVKRFGRPVYSGRVDLVSPSGNPASGWTLHTIDLSDYIDAEPGILYKVELSMKPSYSLYPCEGGADFSAYEEKLSSLEEKSREFWDDPENYYEDGDEYVYYSFGFDWRDRDNPCKASYFSPERRVTRNILASNFGVIAKRGTDNELYVSVNDLLTAQPLSNVTIDVFDYQLQQIVSGSTTQNGSVKLKCDRKPFLLVARKDKDRNYLKINEGSSLSVSSFDVSGIQPDKGIKAFIYGERDVWRPGDSIYLSVFIKDLNKTLPADHPVQFELFNPLEQRIDFQVKKPEGRNLIVFRTATAVDAVTGGYRANVKIGGAEFSKRVRIETVKPNRLKIDLGFGPGILRSSGGNPGTLKVRWLNGANAGNLKATVEYLLKHTKTEFGYYSKYDFDDPASNFYSETVRLFDGSLDAGGNATLNFNPGKTIASPGMLNAVFTAKVAERGGDESIVQTFSKYAPYDEFVGINLPGLKDNAKLLYTDRENEVSLVTVDPEGKPVDTNIDLVVYKISYRWWWESNDEDLAAFIANDNYKPVINSSLRTTGGKASMKFSIPRNEWGRYLIRASIPGGHSTGKIVLIDWPWEYGMKTGSEGATLISVSTDKVKYSPGEVVRLSFPAPENSRAIVTLENSTSVLDEIPVNTTKGNTVVSFKAKPEMAPDVYAWVTVIQPHSQTVNDMPMRLYGIVPVMVEDPDTRLQPEIKMADEIQSGKNVEIRVSEKQKKPMHYTIAVVDEGLLDITGFKTPDPWNYFYAKEALGVRTWDLYDNVLGAFGGTLDRVLATGGDEALIDRSANKARRFTPVVKFLGPFNLGPGKTGIHRFELPQYTGAVRTMVIAGNENAFGFAEKSTFVRDPLMVLATVPRVVSPGEKIVLPVTLFVQKDGIGSLAVTAEGNDLISFEEKIRTLPGSGQGERNTEFVFTAGGRTGTARFKISATGGGETAVYEMEVAIRNPNPPATKSEFKFLEKGQKWETSFSTFGIEGSNYASLEISSLPSFNLEKRIGYLLDYPHGCTEQVVSGAFPQLWINDLSAGDASAGKTASSNIMTAIDKVIARQMNNGGIVLWPGNMQPDNWVTSYAGHFMSEAEKLGYKIPGQFWMRWISYQKKTAREWKFDPKFKGSANDQAYRLFTLALAGDPEKGIMNRLRETEGIPMVSRLFLAAAFASSGRPEVAGELLDMRNLATEEEYSGYYYGSELRDKAIVLYTLTLLRNMDQGSPVLKEVCNALNREEWYSTQSTAWGILSYMKFVEAFRPDRSGESRASVIFNGEKFQSSVPPGKIDIKKLKQKEGMNKLEVENLSEKPLYVNLIRKGIPLSPDEAREEKGLSMKVSYLDTGLNPVDPASLEQGSDFLMVVNVSNTTIGRIDNIALTEMMPSGWEIQNTRMFEANFGIKEGTYDYRDFRDDRVNTYFSLNQGESKTFAVILNAAYKGEFIQPSVSCEAMYTPNCYSRVPGGRVKITGPALE